MSGSAINFIGLLIGSASQFGVVFVLATELQPAKAGLFLIGYAIFRLAVGVFGLGLNITAVRYVALYRGRTGSVAIGRTSRTVLGLSIAAGVVGATSVAAASGLLAGVFHSGEMQGILIALALGIPCSTFTLTAAGVARGQQRTSAAIFLDQVGDSGFRFFGLCIGLAVGRSPLGAAVGFTAGGVVAALAAAVITRHEWFGRGWESRRQMKELLRFSGFPMGDRPRGDGFQMGGFTPPRSMAIPGGSRRLFDRDSSYLAGHGICNANRLSLSADHCSFG